jgi:AcrR family transcriptional regulator
MAHVSAAERRPQLVRAAIDVMVREGVGAASTRAIAAELGIAQAMVHYVFGTKDELYRAVIEQVTADVTARVQEREELPAGSDFRSAVEAIAHGLWRAVGEEMDAFALMSDLVVFGLRLPSLRPLISDYQRQLDAAFADAFRDAVARTGLSPVRPVEDVATFFFAGIDGLLVHRMTRQSDDPAYVRCLEDLIDATTAMAQGSPRLAALAER